MDSKLGNEIKYAKLHGSDAFIPGLGGLGSTLPPPNKVFNLKMYHAEKGIELNFNQGKTVALIPWANVQLVEYTTSPEKK